jgi:hypothetical protein
MSKSGSGSRAATPVRHQGKIKNMISKSLLLIGTLALAGIANAKSYTNMIISTPTKAGSHQMAAGEYSLKVMGSIAIFTNVDTGKKFIAVVKVEDAGKKFDATEVDCTNENGMDQITSIDLGGSSTKLELGE